jgi:hypothetical protein
MVKRLKENPRRWYEINGLPAPEELQPENRDSPEQMFVDDMFNRK